MSKAVMEAVIGKAMLETGFRYALLANPDGALAAFDLLPREKARLKRLDNETLELLAKILNACLSRESQDSRFTNKATKRGE
jgi:hypothetical protein